MTEIGGALPDDFAEDPTVELHRPTPPRVAPTHLEEGTLPVRGGIPVGQDIGVDRMEIHQRRREHLVVHPVGRHEVEHGDRTVEDLIGVGRIYHQGDTAPQIEAPGLGPSTAETRVNMTNAVLEGPEGLDSHRFAAQFYVHPLSTVA